MSYIDNCHQQQYQSQSINYDTSLCSLKNNNSLDDLPKQFVSSLRILFDILDENHSGYVRLLDIESRWKEDGVKGLPPGVVDALRKVTPQNGYLNFDRFVAGLKLVLWRNKLNDSYNITSDAEQSEQDGGKENNLNHYNDENSVNASGSQESHNHPSSSSPNVNSQFFNRHLNTAVDVFNNSLSPTTGAVNESGRVGNQYTALGHQPSVTSVTNLDSSSSYNNGHSSTSASRLNINGSHCVSVRNNLNTGGHLNNNNPRSVGTEVGNRAASNIKFHHSQRLSRPADRLPLQSRQVSHTHLHCTQDAQDTFASERASLPANAPYNAHRQAVSPPQLPARNQTKTNILNELKIWQQQRMKHAPPNSVESYNINRCYSSSKCNSGQNISANDSKNMDKNIYANIDSVVTSQPKRDVDEAKPVKLGRDSKYSNNRRWDGRRHTLNSGVDHIMIKRMRQLEEEKEILKQGIEMVESAGHWYQKQISSVDAKLKGAAWSSYNDSSFDANQERMNFQKTRISEVNQQLRALIDSSEKGFPLHMNLAVSNVGQNFPSDEGRMKMLKDQNRQLTQEISVKCDKITQLEQEKSALIRELFESKSKNKPNLDDTTFM
ncbi:bromodomain-containing protein DDB_G0280777-like isoform X2 [Argonauta hians]